MASTKQSDNPRKGKVLPKLAKSQRTLVSSQNFRYSDPSPELQIILSDNLDYQ